MKITVLRNVKQDFWYLFPTGLQGGFFFKDFQTFLKNHKIYPLEPMGSVAPKVDTRDEFTYARVRLNEDKALICPAQSYPVPIFR